MGIIIRQSLKSTTVAYFGVLIGVLNTLFLLPKFFTIEQIGLLRLLQDIPFLLSSFIQLGAANIADRFFPYFKTEDFKNNGLLYFLIVYSLIGFIFFALILGVSYDALLSIFEAKSPLLSNYFYCVIPFVFFLMYNSIFESYCRIHYRIVVPTIIREVLQRVLFALIIIFFALKWISLTIFIYLFVGTYFISTLALIWYAVYLKILHLVPNWKILTTPLLKQIFSYVGYIIPGTAGSLIISKIDTIFIGASKGLSNTGVYSISFFIGSVVEIPKRAISQISIPVITQAWKNNDISTIEDIYKKSSINQLLAGMLIFLCVWCCADELLFIIPNNAAFVGGKYVILFIGLGKIIDMMTGVNSEIILYSKYYRFNLIAMLLLSVITIILNIILIPKFGINGAAISFALSLLIFNIVKMGFIWIRMGIQPFTIGTVKILLIAIAISTLSYVTSVVPSSLLFTFAIIFLKCSLITSFMLVISYYMKVSLEYNILVQQTILFLKKKFSVFS